MSTGAWRWAPWVLATSRFLPQVPGLRGAYVLRTMTTSGVLDGPVGDRQRRAAEGEGVKTVHRLPRPRLLPLTGP